MPANRIIVTWNPTQGYRCGVWDAQGRAHEVTDIFRSIRGATGEGRIYNEIACKVDDVTQKLEFRATAKRLIFDAPAEVVEQIIHMNGG